MKQKIQQIAIDNQRHLWLSQNHTAMKLAMYELNQYGVDILKHLTEQAKIGGVAKEDMQYFIETLLDNQSFREQIIEYAASYARCQKLYSGD